MKTPFTIEQFFGVFEKYNLGIFPAQFIIMLAGLICVVLLIRHSAIRTPIAGGLTGLLWLWMGLVYHILYFSGINPAATIFGVVFIIEGIFILYETFIRKRLVINIKKGIQSYLGYFFLIFGIIIYPAIGYFISQNAVQTIALGLPCPTTIFTFGVMILAKDKIPGYLLVIPALWAIIGLAAAINFGVYQDFFIILAAFSALSVVLYGHLQNRKSLS